MAKLPDTPAPCPHCGPICYGGAIQRELIERIATLTAELNAAKDRIAYVETSAAYAEAENKSLEEKLAAAEQQRDEARNLFAHEEFEHDVTKFERIAHDAGIRLQALVEIAELYEQDCDDGCEDIQSCDVAARVRALIDKEKPTT